MAEKDIYYSQKYNADDGFEYRWDSLLLVERQI